MHNGYSIRSVKIGDKEYPELLREVTGAPSLLYYRGILPSSGEKTMAIVGTRKATRDGKLLAKQIAQALAGRGCTIVSGLALGIDAAAHEGALSVHGKTIAVLANGLDTVYPAQHESLARTILEKGGALISEYPEGTQSFKNQFLERNRIVSGMSIATTVIEAPIRSGALVTAKHAAEQGREVFVLPGTSTHPNYEGSHMLIRNGARLVRNAADIFEDLGIETEKISSNRREGFPNDFDEEEEKIFRAIDEAKEPLWVDKISELTTLKIHVVNRTLTSLILKGMVKEKNGKFSHI